MSADTELILDRINRLSVEELLLVRAKIDEKIGEEKADSNQNGTIAPDNSQRPLIYQRTPEEVEAFLAAVFTPEELAEIGKRDFSKMKLEGKSLSEMVNEDREDRF